MRSLGASDDSSRAADCLATDVEGTRLTELGVVLSSWSSGSSDHRHDRCAKPVEQLTDSVVHVFDHLQTDCHEINDNK